MRRRGASKDNMGKQGLYPNKSELGGKQGRFLIKYE